MITFFFSFVFQTECAAGEPADYIDCPSFVFLLKSHLILQVCEISSHCEIIATINKCWSFSPTDHPVCAL